MSRAFLPSEVEAQFLSNVAALTRDATSKESLALSIMALIDGDLPGGLPPFALAPNDTADDQAQRISEGKRFYSELPELDVNIAGSLQGELKKHLSRYKIPPSPTYKPPEYGINEYGMIVDTPKPTSPEIKATDLAPGPQILAYYGKTYEPYALDTNWMPLNNKKMLFHNTEFRHSFLVMDDTLHYTKDPEELVRQLVKDSAYKITKQLLADGAIEVVMTRSHAQAATVYKVVMRVLTPSTPFESPI
jgi:hypothetical protein